MSDHLTNIGIPIASEDDFAMVTEQLCALALVDGSASDGQRLVWRDPSGAAMAFHLDKHDRIQCLTPFFAPSQPSFWRASGGVPRRDPTCLHCSGADFDLPGGSCHTRATIQLVDFATWQAEPRAADLDLAVSAFADSVQFFDDASAFERAQNDPAHGGLRLADEAFLPLGMFGPADSPMEAAACALFSGRILQHRVLKNEQFGALFHWVRVATLPGPIDVLHGGQSGETPRIGGIARVHAWLVGRASTGLCGHDSLLPPVGSLSLCSMLAGRHPFSATRHLLGPFLPKNLPFDLWPGACIASVHAVARA